MERDLSGSYWAWRTHHQPTETALAQGWQGPGRSLSPACLLEGPRVARGSAFSTPPPKSRGAPQSLKQVTGEAVTLEGTSNRTSGPCSASQSLRDYDGLKFRPGKLAKRTTQCHHSAPGDMCVQLTWLPRKKKCNVVPLKLSLLTTNRVFLLPPPRGWWRAGPRGNRQVHSQEGCCFFIFQYIFRLFSYCCLRSTVNKMCLPLPHPTHPQFPA